MSDKTEEPTPRRLEKARAEGDSPISAAAVQALAFAAALALVPAAVVALAARAQQLFVRALSGAAVVAPAVELARDVVTLSLPLILGAALAAALAGIAQTGGIVALKKVAPDLAKLDPAGGLKALFSAQKLIGLARALIAALLVGWIAIDLSIAHAPDIANTAGSPQAGAITAAALAKKLGWIAALVGLGLGAVDLVVTRRAWLQRLRMTKDEVKREHRESEGDPEIKAARRRAHQEMLASATIAAVREATVVVVNPTHLATALRYREDEDETPCVLAQGQGDLAQRMIRAAHAYGVPVIQDVPVARALSELEVGDEIPEALYEAVAEILREAWAELERERGAR